MKRWIKRIAETVLAAFVVVSVGLGVTQLQATASSLSHCIGGAFHCSSQAQCTEACQSMNHTDGVCYPSGCCFCYD